MFNDTAELLDEATKDVVNSIRLMTTDYDNFNVDEKKLIRIKIETLMETCQVFMERLD